MHEFIPDMHHIILSLTAEYERFRDEAGARQQKAYMRNQFEFFGINSPDRRQIYREILSRFRVISQTDIEPIIREIWRLPEREYQYFGMHLADKFISKADHHFLKTIELMITCKSWWDTVDMVASHVAGTFFSRFPGLIYPVISQWMESGNIWLQRSSVLFQLRYKGKTDTDLLFRLIRELTPHEDFFIRKAIGWALREYSKTNPQLVIDFVRNEPLSPLSRKEALKVILRKNSA
ncbi:MAG: DNA alkylation repair protein [Sphingobacteriia bacterium]|nr:DNA alkylation repair protein [Sphingobacteriia bacterium]